MPVLDSAITCPRSAGVTFTRLPLARLIGELRVIMLMAVLMCFRISRISLVSSASCRFSLALGMLLLMGVIPDGWERGCVHCQQGCLGPAVILLATKPVCVRWEDLDRLPARLLLAESATPYHQRALPFYR